MNNPLISVIVPVYNVEAYLRECIDSIINQTYKNLEIILVDDGSPDNSPKICDSYQLKDPRIKVIHKKNGGLSSARNAGLAIATGEFVSFIDSDDFIKEDMYTKMVAAVQKCNANMCLCRCITYNQNGEYGSYSESIGTNDPIQSGLDLQELLVINGAPKYVICCNKLIRRSVFETLKFVEGKQHEDEFIIHHIYGLCDKVIMIDDILYVYRIREGSIMHQAISQRRLDAVEALIDRTKYFLCCEKFDLAEICFLQAVERFIGITLRISQIDSAVKKRVNDLRGVLRVLSKKVSTQGVPLKRKIKLRSMIIIVRLYVLVKYIDGCISKKEI